MAILVITIPLDINCRRDRTNEWWLQGIHRAVEGEETGMSVQDWRASRNGKALKRNFSTTLMALNLVGSLSAYCCKTWRAEKPREHSPWRMGRSNPPNAAMFGSM